MLLNITQHNIIMWYHVVVRLQCDHGWQGPRPREPHETGNRYDIVYFLLFSSLPFLFFYIITSHFSFLFALFPFPTLFSILFRVRFCKIFFSCQPFLSVGFFSKLCLLLLSSPSHFFLLSSTIFSFHRSKLFNFYHLSQLDSVSLSIHKQSTINYTMQLLTSKKECS